MSKKRPCKGRLKGKGNCNGFIEDSRAVYKQTQYCVRCARIKKRVNSLDARKYKDRRDYLRVYMQTYRKDHSGLSTPYVRKSRAKKKRMLAAAA